MRPIERERKLVRVLSQDFAERLGDDAAHLESLIADPKTKPVTNAMTIAYLFSPSGAQSQIAGICNYRGW